MACDVTSLEVSACANGLMQAAQNEVLYRALLMQLLCNAGGGGGGGTGTQVVIYTGASPSTPPATPTSAAIAYSEDPLASVFYWNVTTKAWQ